MALGIVATSSGVSTYTKDEIDLLMKKAMYSEGKIVVTGSVVFSYNSDGTLKVPAETDYVKLVCTKDDTQSGSYGPYYTVPSGTKLAKGSTITTSSISNAYATISFGEDGTIRFVGYYSTSKGSKASYIVTGYQYY